MTHLAIYSLEKKAVEYEKAIADGAKIQDEVEISKGSEYLADLPLVDYQAEIYQGECRCRGGDWTLYRSDKPFSWDIVTPKLAEVE